MPSAAFYRREAERCRASAAATLHGEAAVRWLRIAKDYDALAKAVAVEERKLSSSPPVIGAAMQQQPVQQQQSKRKPEDKK
jgi:hypothetical protein